jgi:hypothetical protein
MSETLNKGVLDCFFIIGEVRSFCMAPSANPRIVVFVRTGCLFAKPEDTEIILDCQAHGV